MALFNERFDNMIAATAALAPLAQGENVRDTRRERIASLFADCVGQARSLVVKGKKDEAAALVADLFVLAFQTRDCRGGKGEKGLFYALVVELYRVYPETVGRLLPLIPEYGYHKDFTLLVTHLNEAESTVSMQPLQQQLMMELARLLKRDAQKFDEAIAAGKSVSEISLSLVSKYAPREGKVFAKSHRDLFHFFLEQMFPHGTAQEHPKVLYRRLLAKISPAVETVETKMCGKRFGDIAFDSVPSVASKKYRKAFLNESLESDCHESQLDTGNRHPEDADRKAPAIDLGRLVPLVDVSGSMSGTPMEVAIALGILVSEINDPTFRHRFLTFETSPQWARPTSTPP
eukprot:gene1353-987_t